MKIFISSSKHDEQYTDVVSRRLVNDGHEIFNETLNIKPGDNWFRKINEGIKEFDAVIIILSKGSINSKRMLREIESIFFSDISTKATQIVPITTDGSLPPSYLMKYQAIDLSLDINLGLQKLSEMLSENRLKLRKTESLIQSNHSLRNTFFIERLRESLKLGELTLICGAGVSISAKIPSWNELLLDLIKSMMKRISDDGTVSFAETSSEEYQKRLKSSSLVMGKYLKSNLGKDFLKEVRHSLYKNNPGSCELIDAIIDLARPQRDGKPLDSIITFNFDGLIEENLDANNLRYKAIDSEGIRNAPDELPIYHVHGYLPRKGKINPANGIVFSEDSYHTKFIDPFSWSNLIQLNKLNQSTCLFVGLSLNDPNLRRLLDVANRKDPSNNLNHYIIKKAPNLNSDDDRIDELMMFLEEQDANELGLNVLWVYDFDEIGPLLRKLIH